MWRAGMKNLIFLFGFFGLASVHAEEQPASKDGKSVPMQQAPSKIDPDKSKMDDNAKTSDGKNKVKGEK